MSTAIMELSNALIYGNKLVCGSHEIGSAKIRYRCSLSAPVWLMKDFMALLAYEEPKKSPMFHLLSMDYKQHIVDSLNRTIFAHTKWPAIQQRKG